MVIKKNGHTLRHGDRISLKMDGIVINDARISISGCYLYVCNNHERFNGNQAPEQFGYKHGWNMMIDEFSGLDEYIQDVKPYCKDELAKIVLDMIKESCA